MDPEGAARVRSLLEQGKLLEAAELCESRGDHRQALALFERACVFDRAADMARRCEDAAAAVRLTVLHKDDGAWRNLLVWLEHRDRESLGRIAAALSTEGRHQRAAELYRLAGRSEEAAADFERAGRHVQAAEAFEAAGLVARAAAVLEAGLRQPRIVEPNKARLKLGRIYSQYGKHEAAVRVLQRLPKESPERKKSLSALEVSFAALGLAHALEELQYERQAAGDEVVADGKAEPSPEMASGAHVLFGRYVVQMELAVTPHARLYKAEDRLTGHPVALKILSAATHGAGRDALQRFVREAKALSQLRHPNVLPLVGYLAEGPAMVLRWMPGGSLEELLSRESISPARAAEICLALLRALEQAHRLGILHRDIKPSNLLFDDAGTPYLADFGVAHLSSAQATVTAAAMGTVAYMSPEQRDGKAAKAQSDLFSVGVLLHQMLSGKPPQVDRARLGEPLNSYHADLDATHDRLLARFLAPRPADRFGTAREALEAVTELRWSTRVVRREESPAESTSNSHAQSPPSGRQRLIPSSVGPLGQQHSDRWLKREVMVMGATEQARAAAFARANHPSLATVFRVCPDSHSVWVALPPGQPLAAAGPFGRLTGTQLEQLREALTALHQSGGVHGAVDSEHVFRDADGQVVLAMARRCPETASEQSDWAGFAALPSTGA